MKELNWTQSICPVCKKPIKGVYRQEGDKVFFVKECSEHGEYKALVANKAEDYINWTKSAVINIPPKRPLTKGAKTDEECPLHCGTCENHLQTACCVIIDITNRCNQHCPYCFARAEMDTMDPGEPTLAELEEKFDFLVELGEERPFNIQLSGGEPTVRDDLPEIIQMAKAKGFDYIQINSNGRRIAQESGYGEILQQAGASVIFMQFDGTNDDIYLKLRGESLLEEKKQAIDNCKKAGLPVALVPMVVRDVNLDNVGEMMKFLLKNLSVVKGIHFQPVSFFGRYPGEETPREDHGRVTMFDVLHALEDQFPEFHYKDFAPIVTGHTLCCFYTTYLKEGDKLTCMVTGKQKEEGVSCCDSGACGSVDPLEIIEKDRDYVVNKWAIAEDAGCDCDNNDQDLGCCENEDKSDQPMDLDQFLKYYKNNTFTVTGMAFQDSINLDAERLKRCRVQVLSQDNRLIPFCGYNSIYRGDNK
ncbi:MAG: radical SAM protein [Anaerovoracaceae bacterium]